MHENKSDEKENLVMSCGNYVITSHVTGIEDKHDLIIVFYFDIPAYVMSERCRIRSGKF